MTAARLIVALWLSATAMYSVPAGVAAQAADTSTASVNELLQTARVHVQRGDRAAALDALRRARVLAPNSEEVLSALAQVALTGVVRVATA